MKSHNSAAQRGATLVVGLIMLVLITLMVTTAFKMSTSNLKSVGNMQFRDEAIGAANAAIEQVLASPFTTAPAAESINVDINKDGTVDYVVSVAAPTCIRATQAAAGGSAAGAGSSVTVTVPATTTSYNTVWDIDATVTDASSGASVNVRSGVRVTLTQTQKDAVCP